jgi:hypothetical protein
MTMLNQLFGLKNVKTSSELRSVGKRKKDRIVSEDDCPIYVSSATQDSWNTDAKDALRVPILAKAHNHHLSSSNASLPAFGLSADKNKYQLSEANPYGVNCDLQLSEKLTASPSLPTLQSDTPSASDLIVTTLGLYSKSVAYSHQIQALLIDYDLNVHVFGPTDMDTLQRIGSNISTWVIDLSDEGGCPVLDVLLDEYGDVPSLFLSDKTPSTKCITKLNAFIQNDTLKLTA